eukprot:223906_1
MSATIYCGKKYGIIYESTFKLYQLKLQNIKGNKIKFVKMKSNGVPKIFGAFQIRTKTKHSLNMIYLNKINKIFAVRNHFSARDNRARKNIPKPHLTKIPCGIYDLETSEWERCGNFVYKPSFYEKENFKTSMVYNENKNIIYVFGGNGKWIKSYDLNKNEWVKSTEKLNRDFGQGAIFKFDKFENMMKTYYFANRTIRCSKCNVNDKKVKWNDVSFSENEIEQHWNYSFIG